jgi:hypothetical protein
MENIKNEWPTFDFDFEFPEARDFQFVSLYFLPGSRVFLKTWNS